MQIGIFHTNLFFSNADAEQFKNTQDLTTFNVVKLSGRVVVIN